MLPRHATAAFDRGMVIGAALGAGATLVFLATLAAALLAGGVRLAVGLAL